jgi:hypothetical protein
MEIAAQADCRYRLDHGRLLDVTNGQGAPA